MKFEILREETNEAQIMFSAEIDNERIGVAVNWQGCSNFYASTNPLHVCELGQLAETLRRMRIRALQYFDGEFCVAPLRADQVRQKINELNNLPVEDQA